MEKDLFKKYADKLLSAMKREGLMNKEVAEIFQVPASYMSSLWRYPEEASISFMDKVRVWDLTDQPLRWYKLPGVEEVVMSQSQLDEAAGFQIPAGDIKISVTPVGFHGDPAAGKKRIAAKTRKVYEQKPETIEEATRVETKGGKVDLSGIDFRTGVLAVLEIYEDGFILRTKMPVKS